MRYDKRIYFVKEGEDEYDYSTGNYVTSEPIKHEVWANVSDTGEQRMNVLYGGIKQGALTIRIRNKYNEPFDFIEAGDKTYQVMRSKLFRHDAVFEVSERA